MKIGKVVALAMLVSLGACSTEPEDEPTRRRTTSTTDQVGDSQSGVLLVELSAANATATVNQQVVLTAQGWLDTGRTAPVTAGTDIRFSVAGHGTLSATSGEADSSGKSQVTLTSNAPGAVTVEAAIGDVVASTIVTYANSVPSGGGNPGGQVSDLLVSSSVAVLPVNDGSPLNSSDQATITVTLLGTNVASVPVKLSSTSGSVGTNLITTNASGVATFTYTSGMVAGDAVISVEAAGKTASVELIVLPGVPATIEVGAPSRTVIGLQGSGSPESSVVTFTVKDKYGNLVDDSNVVTFTLNPVLVGSYISPATISTNRGVVAPVLFSGTQAGTTRLVASVNGRTVTSAAISIAGSVITPEITTVDVTSSKATVSVNDGSAGNSSDQTNITVTVLDQTGAGMQGVSVQLASVGGSLSTAALTTDVNGQASATYTAGTLALNGSVTASAGAKNDVVAIRVTPGAPAYMSAANPSRIEVPQAGSGAEIYSSITYTVRDQYGNLVSDQTVLDFTLSPALGGATVSPSSLNTQNGQATVYFHPGSSTGSTRVVATVSGGTVNVASAAIEVTMGAIGSLSFTSNKSSVRVFDSNSGDTSDEATLVATVRNWAGSPMQGVPVRIAISGAGSLWSAGVYCSATECLGTSDASGNFTVSYTAGLSVGGVDFQASAIADNQVVEVLDIAVYAGEPYTITGARGSDTSRDLEFVTFVVADEYGNRVSNGTLLNFTLTPALAGSAISPTFAYTEAGVAQTFIHEGTTPGSTGVQAEVYGTSLNHYVSFDVGAGDADTMSISASANEVTVYDDSALDLGDQATITVTLTDEFGNAIAGEAVSFAASDGILSATQVLTDGSGNASVTYTAGTLAGNVVITAEADGLQESTTINVLPGAAFFVEALEPTESELGLAGSGLPESSSVAFVVRDIYGNLVTDGTMVSFSLNPTVAGATVAPSSIFTTNGQAVAIVHTGTATGSLRIVATVLAVGSPTGMSQEIVVSGSVSEVSSVRLTSSKPSVSVYDDNQASSSDQALITITVRDQEGLAVSGVPVSLSASSGNLSSDLVVSDSFGTASVTFTAGLVAETAVITARGEGVEGRVSVVIKPGSAYVIEMGIPNPSVLGLDGSGKVSSSVVPVTVKDKYGNLASDNTVVEFSLVPALTGASVAPVTITTRQGAISPVVHAGTQSGSMRLMATVGGRSVISREIIVEGAPASQVGSVTLSANKTAIKVNDGNALDSSDEASLVVTVLDLDGAAMSGVEVSLSASAGSLSNNVVATDGAGTAAVVYTSGIVAETVEIVAVAEGVEAVLQMPVGPGEPTIIEMGDPQPAQLGVKGSGSPESSIVQVFIKDQSGNPVSDSTTVSFRLEPVLGGATVSPAIATTHDGAISAVINTGTKSGTMRLVATVGSHSVTSGKITVFGGLPSADRFELVVESGKRVMSGFGTTGLNAGMTVVVTDTFGNPPQPGTSVYVACEAGRCGANNTEGIQTNEKGIATFDFETAFANLVHNDVNWPSAKEDFGGFVGTNHTWPVLKDRRRGYVTIIALTTGQSGYDDINGNNVFDAGLDILSYVDVNGNYAYDAGIDTVTGDPSEPYLDINSNDAYDSYEDFWDFDADGTWDSHDPASYHEQQYIWSENTIIYATTPNLQFVPQQYIDLDGDNLFDWDTDLVAIGGPVTASNDVEFRAEFADLAASNPNMKLQPGYASYVSSGTTITASFSDNNDNPLPFGSSIELTASEGLSVEAPPQGARTYGADYFFPLSPVNFMVKEAEGDLSKPDRSVISVCTEIDIGDGPKVSYCMNGVKF